MGYHRDKTLNSEAMQELALLLKEASNAADVKRLQCVYFRGKGLDAEEIADRVQYSADYVKRVWTQYFREGAYQLMSKPRGGRRHALMSQKEEEEVLAAHTVESNGGKLLKIAPLHRSLCEKLGREVALSTAYRLARRHGWRKVEPKPRHPGRNAQAAEYFKVFFPEAS